MLFKVMENLIEQKEREIEDLKAENNVDYFGLYERYKDIASAYYVMDDCASEEDMSQGEEYQCAKYAYVEYDNWKECIDSLAAENNLESVKNEVIELFEK